MTVSAVGQKENTPLHTVVKSTALGAVGGYSLKYLLPVTKRENNISYRKLLNLGRKVANEDKCAEFVLNGERSPAKDTFEKLVLAKDRKVFSYSNIKSEMEALGGKNSAAGKELRTIIREADIAAKEIARGLANGYRGSLKAKRQTIPFIVGGAGLGFLAGFMKNFINDNV